MGSGILDESFIKQSITRYVTYLCIHHDNHHFFDVRINEKYSHQRTLGVFSSGAPCHVCGFCWFITSKSSLYGLWIEHIRGGSLELREILVEDIPTDGFVGNLRAWSGAGLGFKDLFQKCSILFLGKWWNYMKFDKYLSTGLQLQTRLESGGFMQCFLLDPPRHVSYNGTSYLREIQVRKSL